jgi:hypothetical protein
MTSGWRADNMSYELASDWNLTEATPFRLELCHVAVENKLIEEMGLNWGYWKMDKKRHWRTVCFQLWLDKEVAIAQSFSPFLAWDGWQVRRPSWIWATSLLYFTKQVCCPSWIWATNLSPISWRKRTKRLGYYQELRWALQQIDAAFKGMQYLNGDKHN